MKKMLLIVDPQNDFITGALAVDGAREAMDSLAEYIRATDGMYSIRVVTADSHPCDHMSFIENGGRWVSHCVAGTPGAAIWDALLKALDETSGKTVFLKKGTIRDTEEYSIFKNGYAAGVIRRIVEKEGIDTIDLCGIAGDICVLDTLTDGRKLLGKDIFNVLTDFSPSIDGGKALMNAISRQ